MAIGDDVELRFGADATDVESGVQQAVDAVRSLQDEVRAFGERMDSVGSLTARQVGSVASLFDRLGLAAGFALGPIGILGTELVRASQHFEEFDSAAQAIEAIGATLYKAVTNPLTIAIGVLVAAGAAAVAFFKVFAGPEYVTAEQALKDISALIKEVGDRWKTAGDQAQEAMRKTDLALRAGITMSLAEARDALTGELAKIQEGVRENIADLATLPDVANAPFFDALQEIAINGKLTTDQITTLRNTLDQMVVDNPTNEALIHLAATFDKTTDSADQLIKAVAALQGQAGSIAEAGAGGVLPEGESMVPSGRFDNFDDLGAKAKLTSELKALEASSVKATSEFEKAQTRAIESVRGEWEGLFTTIISGFDTAISGLLNGTMTWRQAFLTVIGTVWQEFAKMVEQMVAKWLAGEAMKLAVSKAAVAEETADVLKGQAIQSGVLSAHLIQQILASAQGVFAGIFSFLSPFLGPAAAVPATAGAATVAAAAAAVPALATGAWNIPEQMLAMLHPGETVLPAPFASAFRESMAGGGGGGEVHIHLSAIDTRSGARFLQDNAGEIAKAIQSEMRRANGRLRPSWAT